MNSLRLICCVLALSATLYAEDSRIEELVQKRIALLTKIHDTTIHMYEAGDAAPDQVRTAALELYTLQRDAAKTVASRVQFQKRIVAIANEQKADAEQQAKVGSVTTIEVLRATEHALAEEQKLLEIQAAH
jgi:hypothetical protein